LLLGFAILARHFEESGVPEFMQDRLPKGFWGPFLILVFVFIMSSFLDNIAAAIIGGTLAKGVFKGKVHIGFLVAVVAASNAGGSGSVVGDTTTTMMWIDGVNALDVLHAYGAAIPALLFFAFFGAWQQYKLQDVDKSVVVEYSIDINKIVIIALILVGAIISNVLYDMPALGVWIAILVGATFSSTPWYEVKHSIRGTIFLLCLIMSASMMPVNELPPASEWTALSLGVISAVFDNIPLTKLCLEQLGYDWGILAYTVGFGGSMIWFGSSAGVAICNRFPEAKHVGRWVKNGWHVILAYVIGFFFVYYTLGWHPHAPHKAKGNVEVVESVKYEAKVAYLSLDIWFSRCFFVDIIYKLQSVLCILKFIIF